MAKDLLDLKYHETLEFTKPKIIYEIKTDRGGTSVHHYNCYGLHRRKKDFLVRRKVNVMGVAPKEKTSFRWESYKPHLITFDLTHAKKVAVLESEKAKDTRIAIVQKDIEDLEQKIAMKKNLQKKIREEKHTLEDIRENDSNKDLLYFSF